MMTSTAASLRTCWQEAHCFMADDQEKGLERQSPSLRLERGAKTVGQARSISSGLGPCQDNTQHRDGRSQNQIGKGHIKMIRKNNLLPTRFGQHCLNLKFCQYF